MNSKKDIKDTADLDIPNNFQAAYIFNDDSFLYFSYKKSDRLASAFYLVSNFLSDKEPLKWQFREESLLLVNGILSLTAGTPTLKSERLAEVLSGIFRLFSLLEIARVSRLVSEMNFEVLKNELNGLLESLRMSAVRSHPKEIVFKGNFFDISKELFVKTGALGGSAFRSRQGANGDLSEESPRALEWFSGGNNRKESKGHKGVKDSNLSYIKLSDKESGHKGHFPNTASFNSREQVIIDMCRAKSALAVKDFSLKIRGCSEKTIQRMLLRLVKEGVLKREGERRWSRYSLVQSPL